MERGKNFYLTVLSHIKRGDSPAQIAQNLNISKQRLNYYLATLKREGCIKKIGYGVWEFIKEKEVKEVKKTAVIGRNSGHSLKPDTVRGHGFLFKLDLPENLNNWDKREDIFKRLDIKFNPYFVGGVKRGQRLEVLKSKVALTDRSILINFQESYIAETADKAHKDALDKFLRVVKRLERDLRANFSEFGKYKFKVSRQHYALIKNSLARQYLESGEKLNVYSGRGLWLLIDNSYNLEELETVHKDTAVEDNRKVQIFFNELKELEGYTPKLMIQATTQNAQNLANYAQHLTAHVESVKQLGNSVAELTKVVQELKKQTFK